MKNTNPNWSYLSNKQKNSDIEIDTLKNLLFFLPHIGKIALPSPTSFFPLLMNCFSRSENVLFAMKVSMTTRS